MTMFFRKNSEDIRDSEDDQDLRDNPDPRDYRNYRDNQYYKNKRRNKETKGPSYFRMEVQRNWNTFKSLPGIRKKAGFIWDYYRLPIILSIMLLVFAVIFAHMLWEGQKPKRLQVCVVLNSTDSCLDWFADFEKNLQKDGNNGSVDVNEDQPFDYSNSYYYLYELEVMTTISSERMDVAICGPDMYSYILALNACYPLDEALPEYLFTELDQKGMLDFNTANLQIDENGLIHPEDGIPGCYAVNISDTSFAGRYDRTEDKVPLYAIIIRNTGHLNDAVALIRALTS